MLQDETEILSFPELKRLMENEMMHTNHIIGVFIQRTDLNSNNNICIIIIQNQENLENSGWEVVAW